MPPSPYKGLAPFGDSPEDALLFFGRERERQLISANLLAARLTVLYGPSGVGKSSILRAGVAQELRALADRNRVHGGHPEHVVIVFDRWRDDPVPLIREAARAELEAQFGVGLLPRLHDQSTPDALADWTERLDCQLLLVLDQAEEYFLYHGGEGERDAFAETLPELVTRPALRVHVLLAIREDGLALLDRFKGRIPNLFANYLRLDHLDPSAARAAIVGPIDRYNERAGTRVAIEPALVDAVLDQTRTGRVSIGPVGRGRAGQRPTKQRIETPYLQLVMQRLWEEEQALGSRTLRVATLETLGGATEIVRSHLERALAELTPRQQRVAAAAFNHLVTPSGTKVAQSVSDLAEYAAAARSDVEPVVSRLARERILRPLAGNGDGTAGGAPFEIFHDVLAGAVLDWRTRYEADQAVERERLEAQRRHRRLTIIAFAITLALAAMTAVAAYALTQRAQAREQAKTSQARAFAAGARANLEGDPELSLLLALEAAEREQTLGVEDVLRRALEKSRVRAVLPASAARPQVRESRLADAQRGLTVRARGRRVVVRSPRGRRTLTHPSQVWAVAAGPGVVVAAVGDEAFVWNAATGAVLRRLGGHTLAVRDVAVSPDGARHATASTDGTARLWDGASGELVAVLFDPEATMLTRVEFSPDGRTVATAGRDGTVRLWEAEAGRPLAVLAGHRAAVTDVAFAAGGAEVVTRSLDGTVRRWDAVSEPRLVPARRAPVLPGKTATAASGRRAEVVGAEVRVSGGGGPTTLLRGHKRGVAAVAFSADGRFVVTAGEDSDARVWDAATGESILLLRRHFGPLAAASFSPDGRWIVTAGPITAGLWEFASGRFVFFLRGHTARLTAASFAPDGRTIVTADRSGSRRQYRCEICGRLDELVALAEHRLRATGRRLTAAERARYLG